MDEYLSMLTEFKKVASEVRDIRSQLETIQEQLTQHRERVYHRCLDWILAQTLIEVAVAQGIEGLVNYRYRRCGEEDPLRQLKTYNRWVEEYSKSPKEFGGPDPREQSPPFCHHIVELGDYGNAVMWQEAAEQEEKIIIEFREQVTELLDNALHRLVSAYQLKQSATLQPTQSRLERARALRTQDAELREQLEKLNEQVSSLGLQIGQRFCADIETVCYWQEIPLSFAGIYFIFDEEFNLLYIGQSQNVRTRLGGNAHHVMKMESRESYLIGLIPAPLLEFRLKREAELIRLFNPVYNTKIYYS